MNKRHRRLGHLRGHKDKKRKQCKQEAGKASLFGQVDFLEKKQKETA